MTEEEKAIIKVEVYKAYSELPTACQGSTKLVMALKLGLERAQKKINSKNESR